MSKRNYTTMQLNISFKLIEVEKIRIASLVVLIVLIKEGEKSLCIIRFSETNYCDIIGSI
jgi:hypothetical protein